MATAGVDAKVERVEGRACVLRGDDIDTDRIIPARFLRCVTFDGLGEHAFEDDRKQSKGDHPLDDERYAGANILVVGRNFGCGSSREHAPQAIAKFGFRAVVAESFAEIFFGNSTTLGMPCVSVSRETVLALGKAIEADPKLELTIDLEKGTVSAGSLSFPATMKPAARDARVKGEWDPIGQLLDGAEAGKTTAASLDDLRFNQDKPEGGDESGHRRRPVSARPLRSAPTVRQRRRPWHR
jgi:3-isopropylmalate/(R)-2-methylmalate dehydratase small subunit